MSGTGVILNRKSVIRMLSGEYGKHNKSRNRILMGAVILCIVTLTMVFGIAYGKVQAEYIKAVRGAGTTASARIEDAGLPQYQKVRTLGYVKQAGRCVTVGTGESTGENTLGETEKQAFKIQVLDKPAWEKIVRPAYTDICGDYPAKKQEIMLSLEVLKAMGIDRPKAGMKISLTVSIGLFRKEQEEFSLCGWYTDYIDLPSDSGTGYISEAKYKDWGYDISKESDILICQSDNMDWRETEERLYQDIGGNASDLRINACNTFAYDAVNRLTGSYGMAILGSIVILCGMFFLIYNVMQISMAGDIRQMGLLNTIGATEKQLRSIYFGQIRSILVPGVLAGLLLSVLLLRVLIPEILGNQYLSGYGKAEGLEIFRPELLIAAVAFAVILTLGAAAKVICRVVNTSCVESMNYMPSGKAGRFGRKRVPKASGEHGEPRRKAGKRKRSANGELWYMAWQNLNRYRGRFVLTVFSLFLGMETCLAAVVITKGSDYTHVIEKRPDFLIAGEFSDWGKEEGYGKEYRTRDAGEDPMETEGGSFCLLYGNAYDEFEPVSSEVRDALLGIDGVEESYVMEGAYMISTISREGLRPLVNKYSDMQAGQKEGEGYGLEYSMIQNADTDVIQILSDKEIRDLQQFVQENNLPVDMESMKDGTGVAILHDHQLTPRETKLAKNSVGEPVYFTAMRSREEQMAWNLSDSQEREDMEEAGKQSETFTISGYIDNQAEGFPDIRQTWHGAEGMIYYLISEEGFEKLPTEKKTLYMELNVDEEKEPGIKTEIHNIISRENQSREKMETGVPEEEGEAGIFCISKSDLLTEAAGYIRGSRLILGSISMVLLFAGLTNYFNVIATGIISRRKEMEIMESIGMTKRQKKRMLAAEGMYYCLSAAVLMLTVGSGIWKLICIHMESRLSYFVSGYPVGWMLGLLGGLAGICLWTAGSTMGRMRDSSRPVRP